MIISLAFLVVAHGRAAAGLPSGQPPTKDTATHGTISTDECTGSTPSPCSPFSGNGWGCCVGGDPQKCGSWFSHATCGGDTPVCCNSNFETHCCPAGSTCSAGCRNSIEGGCHCKTEPTDASIGYNHLVAVRLAAAAAASQCDAGAIERWDCAACAPWARLESVHVTEAIGHLAFTGYDATAVRIVLVIRGALSVADWMKAFAYKKVGAYAELGCTACHVHSGFLATFRALEPGIVTSVRTLLDAHPGAPIAIAGHSLGGAVAVHAAIALKVRLNLTLDSAALYSYGAPRVGDAAFATFAMGHLPSWMRLVHWNDPVPHLPPASMAHHFGREIWLDEPSTSKMICNGSGEDTDCSGSVDAALVIDDHFTYLGNHMVQCKPLDARALPTTLAQYWAA